MDAGDALSTTNLESGAVAARPALFFPKRGILRQHASLLGAIQQTLDISIAAGCLYALAVDKFGEFSEPYRFLLLIGALLMLFIYRWLSTYDGLRMGGLWFDLKNLGKAWSIVWISLVTLGFVTKTSSIFSREVLLGWAIVGYAGQALFHALIRTALHALRFHGHNLRYALLIGDDEAVEDFYRRVAANPWLGIEAVGYLTPEQARPSQSPKNAERSSSIPWLGSAQEAAKIVDDLTVDMIYITLSMSQAARAEDLVKKMMPLNVDVNWVPRLPTFPLVNHCVREIDGQPILCLSSSPLNEGRWISKRIEDIVLAAIILILISPLMLAIAVGVKLSSPGPILFRQRRGGLDGKEIVVWKFRTMRYQQGEVFKQATRADPRVTRFGAFLRRTSLDELPQFFNVLQGRMSIVGPRPLPLELNEIYTQKAGSRIEAYRLRHRITPGITGWAQVNGWRGETEVKEKMAMRLKHDLYYLNNWSVWFDLRIIARTVWCVLFARENAY